MCFSWKALATGAGLPNWHTCQLPDKELNVYKGSLVHNIENSSDVFSCGKGWLRREEASAAGGCLVWSSEYKSTEGSKFACFLLSKRIET